ncbi:MAG: ChrR family anti-sigma-E factor [Pseudomonadota bacterium]
MTPSFHPSHEVLVDYAAGAVAPGQAMVIATHLRACAACRGEVALADAVGGALLGALPPAPMREDALARALAGIERPARNPPPPPAPRPDWIPVPSAVLEAARRRRWSAPGVWVAPVLRGPGEARAYLLRVAAGMSVPHHGHRGAEMVCVLKGAYADRGDVHEPGDFAQSDESVDHTPTVTLAGECVCLIAAEGALIPRNWVGRLFQPFVRI